MKAVIMAGGFGTRLRPLTYNIPKPMTPIINKPVMEHIVDLLKNHGIKDIVSILYYVPETITGFFKEGKDFDINMKYVTAVADYGTAGSVKNGEEHLKDDSFIIISGDVVTDIDLTAAIDFHKKSKSLATIVLTRVENPLAFGVVITDKNGKITRFLEKPSWGEVFSDTVNTGIYILEPEVLEHIPYKENYDFSKDLFPKLLAEGKPIYGYITEGYWRDVGNIGEYKRTHRDILLGEVDLEIAGKRISKIGRDVWVNEDVEIGKKVQFNGTVIVDKYAKIGDKAIIENSVIGKGCIIGDSSVIKDAIIWEDSEIGHHSEVYDSILCSKVNVKPRSYVMDGAVISDSCKIGESCTIKAGVKMWPDKSLEDGATLSSSLIWGDKWSAFLFSGNKVSGLANLEVTPEFATKLGAAFAANFPQGVNFIASRDVHKNSRVISRAMMCGILSTGGNVRDLRIVPPPIARFEIASFSVTGGFHVRKSPDDPNTVEILFFDENGLDLPTKIVKSVERLFYREDFRRVKMDETGELSFPYRTIDFYKDSLYKAIDNKIIKKRNLKVVIDYSFGSSAMIFPSVLGKLGCEAVSLNAYVDVNKITRTSEEKHLALKQLSDIVISLKADIGFLIDNCGEKVFLVDEKGHLLPEESAQIVISLLAMRSPTSKNLAVPVNGSGLIDNFAKEYKKVIYRTQTNERAIMEAGVKNPDVTFVAGNCGCYVFPEIQHGFNAMISVAKIVEFLSYEEKSISELHSMIPEHHLLKSTIPCSWKYKGKIMRSLVEKYEKDNIELIDGIKIYKKDGWVLLTPDPETACFHIYTEAKTKKEAEKNIEDHKKMIASWQTED